MSQAGTSIDVDQIVADLQDRVARQGTNGSREGEILDARFSLDQERVVLRPEVAYSSKRIVGGPISALKRALIRLQFHFLDDMVGQVNTAIDGERRARTTEAGLRDGLARQAQSLEDEARRLRDLVNAMDERLRAVEPLAKLVAEWDALDMMGRLALVERSGRADVPLDTIRPLPPQIAALALDRGRIDDGGAARLDAYIGHLGVEGPVLVVGCGDGGEVLAALQGAGAEASGVDAADVNVAAGRDRGLQVTLADPLHHLGSMPPDSLGGMAVVGVADRFDADQWLVFADLAATRLKAGAGLVIEMLNAATPGGLGLRMRDPTLPPPVHPDTIAFLLRVAGYIEADVRTFGAFRDGASLPLGGADAPDGIDRIARFVNRFVVGQPLAAVFARR